MPIPGELLLIKMWETLADKGIGSLLTPWQERRVGHARLELARAEILTIAQAEMDAAEIRSGRMCLEDFSSQVRFSPTPQASVHNSPQIDQKVVVETAKRQLIEDLTRRQVNVANIILHAEEALREDAQEPPQEKIDDDWLYRWRDYAGEVSVDSLQQLWGKLLAGKLKSPGSFSLRCLDFLRNLSQDEAKAIEKLSRFAVEDVLWSNTALLEAEGITFKALLEMEDLGILSGIGGLGLHRSWDSATPEKFALVLRSNGKVLLIRHDDASKKLTLQPVYLLTAIGRQILQLGNFEPHIEYLKQVGRVFQTQGFTVTLGDFQKISATTIRFSNEMPIEAQPAP